MKKRGRPAENPADPVTNVITAKLSKEDIRKLDQCSEKLNVTKGQVIRMGINKVYAEIKE